MSRPATNCCASSRTSSIRMTDERCGFWPETGKCESAGRASADLRCDRGAECVSNAPSAAGAETEAEEAAWPLDVSCSGGGRRPGRTFRGGGFLSETALGLDGPGSSGEMVHSLFQFSDGESESLLSGGRPPSRMKANSTRGGCGDERVVSAGESSFSLSKSSSRRIVSVSSVGRRAWWRRR